MEIKNDCRFFPQDRPCKLHKETGIKCFECKIYKPISYKILIIKLDAIGDVLRTTAILPALKNKYPGSHITWITLKQARDIFIGNDLVDVILNADDASTIARLHIEKFDLVINLDTSTNSSILASLANAKIKKGFYFHSNGYVMPCSKIEKKWFMMGAFDDLKKANKNTYQELMLEILDLKNNPHKIILNLLLEEINFAKKFAQKNKLGKKLIIGLNTGSSPRWPQKQWNELEVVRFVNIVHEKINPHILLFGGPDEKLRNQRIINKVKNKVINTGCNNTLREFFALLSLCNILITSDTLALHAACALNKEVIALFGPTSFNEIDLYGRGEKIYAALPCLVCYQTTCDKKQNCMNLIKAEDVMEKVKKLVS